MTMKYLNRFQGRETLVKTNYKNAWGWRISRPVFTSSDAHAARGEHHGRMGYAPPRAHAAPDSANGPCAKGIIGVSRGIPRTTVR
jgi:hypothetical protein